MVNVTGNTWAWCSHYLSPHLTESGEGERREEWWSPCFVLSAYFVALVGYVAFNKHLIILLEPLSPPVLFVVALSRS